MTTTTHSSYHLALVFYPWINTYPLENPSYSATNTETLDPVILASGSNTVSGITSIAYNRRKGVGGTMQIEFTGYHPEEPKLSVGTWCFLSTSHVAPLLDIEAITKKGLVRFIGQVYEIDSNYQVDAASGRLMRKVNMVIREWCHVLHCPLRYHPVSQEQNFNKVAIAISLAKSGGKTETDRNKILANIASSYSNVFQQPALALAWAGALTENNTSVLSVLNIEAKDLHVFSTTIARLPILPQKMLNHLFPYRQLKPDTAWTQANGFMDLLSGVQVWGSGDKEYFGKKVKADNEAKRPVAPTMLDFFTSGESLYQTISNQVSGGGGVEVFADLWYDSENNPKPVLVVRDIPYTLREVDTVVGDSGYPWTYFDDLPVIVIPPERILRISVKQSIHNTANLIQMGVQDSSWSKVAQAQALFYYGTTILGESQKRFGCQTRPKLSIRDIFSESKKNESGDKDISPVAAETRGEKTASPRTEESKAHFQWFAELTRKQIQWFGTDYLFPSCTLVIKDADYPLAAGINVAFSLPNGGIYVGHCEGFTQGFGVDDSGRISSQTTVQLSRLCVVDDGQYKPMSHKNAVNLLGQPNPVAIEAVYTRNGKSEAEAFRISADIEVEAGAKIINQNFEKLNEKIAEVKKKRDEDLTKAIDSANGKGKRVAQ